MNQKGAVEGTVEKIPLVGRFRRFVSTYLSTGDRLGEYFYAVWMVVVSVGIINSTGDPNEEGMLVYTLTIVLLVNLGWGLIDGFTVMFTKMIDRATNDKVVYDLRTKKDDPAVRQKAIGLLDQTMVVALSAEDKNRLLDTLASGEPGKNPYQTRYHSRLDEKYFVIGIVMIEVFVAALLIIPFLIFPDKGDAALATRIVGMVAFAVLGVMYAGQLNKRKWLAALFMAMLLALVAGLSYATGW